jgi:hypothetical protein
MKVEQVMRKYSIPTSQNPFPIQSPLIEVRFGK